VDDHRFARLLGRLQVQAKRLLLQLGRLRFVVIIQTGFTNRDDARVIEFAQQPVQRRRSARLHVQRMHAD